MKEQSGKETLVTAGRLLGPRFGDVSGRVGRVIGDEPGRRADGCVLGAGGIRTRCWYFSLEAIGSFQAGKLHLICFACLKSAPSDVIARFNLESEPAKEAGRAVQMRKQLD